LVSLYLNEHASSYLKYSKPALIAEDGTAKQKSAASLKRKALKSPATIDETMPPFTPANQTLIYVLKLIHAASMNTYLASLHVHVGTAIASSLLILLKKAASTLPRLFFFSLAIALISPILPLSVKLATYRREITVKMPTNSLGFFLMIFYIRYSFEYEPSAIF